MAVAAVACITNDVAGSIIGIKRYTTTPGPSLSIPRCIRARALTRMVIVVGGDALPLGRITNMAWCFILWHGTIYGYPKLWQQAIVLDIGRKPQAKIEDRRSKIEDVRTLRRGEGGKCT